MNDTVLLNTGMKILVEHLGMVEAERFYYIVNKERFDYTEWRQNLFEGMTIEEISAAAMKRRKEEKQHNTAMAGSD